MNSGLSEHVRKLARTVFSHLGEDQKDQFWDRDIIGARDNKERRQRLRARASRLEKRRCSREAIQLQQLANQLKD